MQRNNLTRDSLGVEEERLLASLEQQLEAEGIMPPHGGGGGGSEVWVGGGVVAGVVAMVLLLVLAVLAVTRTRKRRQGSPGPASTATSNTEQVQFLRNIPSKLFYHPRVDHTMMYRLETFLQFKVAICFRNILIILEWKIQ